MPEAKVLGQLLLMQDILINLPDKESIFSFVSRGLIDIPGIKSCLYIKDSKDFSKKSAQTFYFGKRETKYGALKIELSDPEKFKEYEQYIRNFFFMMEVILEEKHKKDLLNQQQKELEKKVEERTKQLKKEIEDRKKIEKELKEQNEEYEALNEELNERNAELYFAKEMAEESDRLKTAFLQNMSHEIRTPMNAIYGFTGMLEYENISATKRKSFISIIQNSAKQLLAIISDILAISSLETKQEKLLMEPVCINDILIELLSIYKLQAANHNISLFTKQTLSDTKSKIYTDKTKLTQILSNLISNALKFTHSGYVKFGYNLKKNHLEFFVEDTGEGIKQEFHEKIFERFNRAELDTNQMVSGTGLGLAICKGFVELLEGEIWVESKYKEGSIFYFTLPYNPVTVELETETKTTESIKSVKTILVAEDEEYNYLFIEEALSNQDYNIIHAKNGEEAIDICKKNPEIDLVLMDIKMPIIDGHSAAKAIKEFRPELKIIAQSAYALEDEIQTFKKVFNDYLTKPINVEELKYKVRTLSDGITHNIE